MHFITHKYRIFSWIRSTFIYTNINSIYELTVINKKVSLYIISDFIMIVLSVYGLLYIIFNSIGLVQNIKNNTIYNTITQKQNHLLTSTKETNRPSCETISRKVVSIMHFIGQYSIWEMKIIFSERVRFLLEIGSPILIWKDRFSTGVAFRICTRVFYSKN